MATLLSNASATGSAVQWGGGTGVMCVVATWGGGNVALQYMGPDEATWVAIGAALTANGILQFTLPPGRIRAAVVTATVVYANAEQVRA